MKANMGTADRIIRLLIAAAIVALYYFDVINGTTAIILLVVAAIFVFTAIINFCPLYTLFGFQTRKKQ